MSKLMDFYARKPGAYFSTVNTAIMPLLPRSASRVLEIGCGEGNTLMWAKKILSANWIGGVELNEKSAEIAARKLDWLMQGDIETLELPFGENSFDLILCLDVLEHLVDPWSVVNKLTGMIVPGGNLVVSIPNVRHHSIILPLLVRGKWTYMDKDILDMTHLRFFTRRSAIELLQTGGLTVDAVRAAKLAPGSRSWLINLCTCGMLRDFFVFQYVVRAKKAHP